MNRSISPLSRLSAAGCLVAVCACLAACAADKAEYDATGNFEATEITVSAQASGELRYFNVQEGQQVDNTTAIGKIDTEQLRLKRDELTAHKQQVAAARKQLAAGKQQLAAGKAAADSRVLDMEKQVAALEQQIANARRERQRFAELVSDGAAPQKQVDDYDNEIRVLQRSLDATREQIGSANAAAQKQSEGFTAEMQGVDAQMEGNDAQRSQMDSQRAQLDDQISKADVKAPVAGVVLEKYVESGEFVAAGKPLFKMADTRHMFLRAYITSAQLEKVKTGSRVTVFADYGDGRRKEYGGTVSWISDKSEFTPKTILTDDERADLVYAVKISVENDGGIKIGMYGEVKF